MSTKTTSAPEVAPPLTIATLKKYAQEVFTPIRRGEGVSTIWPLMAGRRIRNKFIISYPELFSEEIGNPSKYLLVYVEPLELTEESNSGFIRLVAKSILEAFSQKNTKAFKIGAELSFDESLGYSTLLDRLAQLVSTVSSFGLATVLFLGEFDVLSFANSIMYNNLKSVWARAGGSLQFMFLWLGTKILIILLIILRSVWIGLFRKMSGLFSEKFAEGIHIFLVLVRGLLL